jgi:hypothetical protein
MIPLYSVVDFSETLSGKQVVEALALICCMYDMSHCP